MILKAGDTISGQEGRATAIINGLVQDLFFTKSLEATLEKNKVEVKTLGKRGVQHKGVGWSGSGTLSMYYVSTLFRTLTAAYAKTGVDTYFTLVIENQDPTSTIGKQTVSLMNVNLDDVVIAKLNTEEEVLDEDVNFTFDDFEILTPFLPPRG